MAGTPTFGGPIELSIGSKLAEALAPTELQVMNESHLHSGPPGRESHFRVLVVSEKFEGARLVNRHRMINRALKAELDAGLHALAIETLTPAEWIARGGRVSESPACGGSKTG